MFPLFCILRYLHPREETRFAMAEMKDLEICTYLPVSSENLIAVGWLSPGSEYERGRVSEEFFGKLCEFAKDPWQPFVSPGMHQCELCQFQGASGSSNLFIPYGGKIYVAPELITHYIAAHWYRPPDIFIEAVLACPDMRGIEYKKALLDNGGREWVRGM
jgi:hypothetical protein